MKKITKFFSALLALLAVGLITVSLVACSSGDDSSSGGGSGNGGSGVNYVAKYAYTEARDDYKGEKTFIFYKNGTFEFIDEMTLSGEHSYHEKETTKGTYELAEGDWENGKVKLTGTEGEKASEYSGTFTIKDKILKTNFYDFTATYTSKVEADSGKDNSDTKTELVAYKRNTTTSDGDPKTELLTFYSDKTFALHETTADYDLDVCDGTYTGDPTKDGKVTATIKRMVSKQKMTKAFLEMGMAGVVTNKHAPLEACAEETMPCTISGNNLYDDEDKPMTKVGSSDSGKTESKETMKSFYVRTSYTESQGSVTLDKSSAKEGDTVTVRITPATDYSFKSIKVSYTVNYNSTSVNVTEVTEGSEYTFVMPDNNVDVKVQFEYSGATKYGIFMAYAAGKMYAYLDGSLTMPNGTSYIAASRKAGENVNLRVKMENNNQFKSINIYKHDRNVYSYAGETDISSSINFKTITSGEKYSFTMPEYPIVVVIDYVDDQY